MRACVHTGLEGLLNPLFPPTGWGAGCEKLDANADTPPLCFDIALGPVPNVSKVPELVLRFIPVAPYNATY